MEKLKGKLLNSPARYLWERIGIYPHHGIDLPISALRSKKSSGIGEFFDLLPIIDWCHELQYDVLMLLPLNESGLDPSPYNAISSRALHPIYLSLADLPYLDSYPELKNKLTDYHYLNETPRVQYYEVLQKKLGWFREYYEMVKINFLQNPEFTQFRESQHWLETYALFKVLKHKLNQAPWMSWPKHLKSPSKAEYDALVAENQDAIIFQSALQFLCYEQMKSVKNYAALKKVFLKGDVPILINPDSADVWAEPHLFDLAFSAGAPPDAYSQEGQYWICPPFNWEAMRKYSENFKWWQERLAYAGNFYDIFRIDHIVGFFRIWSIPVNHHPRDGRFIPEDPAQWIPQGKEILQNLCHFSNMLPIGEDLGTVPPEARECLSELEIPGTKILRWERRHDQSFIPYSEYPPLSMTSISTHDAEPLSLWWQTFPNDAKAFAEFKGWNYSPNLSFEEHKAILRDSHQTPSLFHINLLQDYLNLFAELTWPDLQNERINIPGTLIPFNWTYRFRPSIEEIVSHEGLKVAMKEIRAPSL